MAEEMTEVPALDLSIGSPLTSPRSRRSLQGGRDLSADELGQLERELEAEIALQMKEDEQLGEDDDEQGEMEAEEQSLDDSHMMRMEQELDAQCTQSPVAPAVESLLVATPLRINTIPEHSSTVTSPSIQLVEFEPSGDFAVSMRAHEALTAVDEKIVTPAAKSSRRKSFMERAAEMDVVTPAQAKRLSLGLSPSPRHQRSASQDIAARLLLTPNSTALAQCMRAAVKHASPMSNVASLAKEFMLFSPGPSANPNAGATSTSRNNSPGQSKIPVLRRVSLGGTESPRMGSRSSDTAHLLERLAQQEAQIVQAGELGQQLIGEMEEMEERLSEEVREKARQLELKDQQLAAQRCELERALKKAALCERQASEWRAQVQEGVDQLQAASQGLVRAQTKITIFEASNQALKKALDGETTRAHQDAQQVAEKRAAEEKARVLDAKLEALTGEVKRLKEELSCASLDAATGVKRVLGLERTVKERDQALATATKQLAALQAEHAAADEEHAQAYARLNAGLEEASTEIERLQFGLREERELSSGLQQQVTRHMATAAAAAMLSPEAPSTGARPIGSARKGRNARLSGMHYSSLLSELEHELHTEILTSPSRKSLQPATATVAEQAPSVLEDKVAQKPSPATALATAIVDAIVPILAVEPQKSSPAKGTTVAAAAPVAAPAPTQLLSTRAPASVLAPVPTSVVRAPSVVAALPQPRTRARSDSAPSASPARPTRVPAGLFAELSEEGDSPSNPRAESIGSFLRSASVERQVGTPAAASVLKRPSSATRLGSWLSAKVQEAENSLRPMFATLTQEESEDEEDKENARRRASSRVNATPTTGKRLVLAQRPGVTQTPTNRPTTSASAAYTAVAATPISRALSEADASRSLVNSTSVSAEAGLTAASAPVTAGDSRVDVLREYFHLATLAVKLSSADENLKASNCSVHELYEEAIESDVPFAHWHSWIHMRLGQMCAAAASHEILRPRMVTPAKGPNPSNLVLPMATPGKVPQGTPLQAMPNTPAGFTGRPAASPLPMRSFGTPQQPQQQNQQNGRVGTPQHGHAQPHQSTPGPQQQRVMRPNGAGPTTPGLAPSRGVLGENNRVANQSAAPAQTPAPSKMMQPGSLAAGVASIHRPAVRGADRFLARGTMTPAGTGLRAPSSVQRPVAAAPVPPTPTSLLSKLTNFVTATPQRGPQPSPRR